MSKVRVRHPNDIAGADEAE
jgi:hypothetical protein